MKFNVLVLKCGSNICNGTHRIKNLLARYTYLLFRVHSNNYRTMAIAPYENLKDFAHSKPPLMVFMACLGFFAVVLMSLAYYVKLTEEIQNPDITQDWNEFLKRFSKVDFCIQPNVTEPLPTTSASTKQKNATVTTPTTLPHIKERDITTETDIYDTTRNYSVSMQLTVIPTEEFIRIPHNVTHVSGVITGDMIGLRGDQALEEINVTMELPYEWNQTKCGLSGCEHITFFACVYFTAASDVFPRTTSPSVCESVNDTGIEYFTTMMPHRTSNVYSSYYCRQRPVIHMRPQIDHTLTVYLSMNDRSVINLHLMHTSYFLFVMVVTILCYALLRGRSHKTKITQTESLLGPDA